MEIKSESEYQSALKRLDVVFMADQSTPEGKEAALLVDAIEAYEDIHHPIGPPEIDLNLIVDPEDNTRVVYGGITDVPLIESIISRAGNTLKLRFLDGSVGEIDIDALGVDITNGLAYIVDGQLHLTLSLGKFRMQLASAQAVWLNTKFL